MNMERFARIDRIFDYEHKYATDIILLSYVISSGHSFPGTYNFEPSCGVCLFPQYFYVFTEFGTGQ